MAEKVRNSIRSFLKIAPAQKNFLQIQEVLDYESNAIKNRIWYRGDSDEIAQLYKQMPGNANASRFWAAVPTPGRDIRKIHTGIPGIIIDILTSIVAADMNEITVTDKKQDIWKKISDDNKFYDLLAQAITDTLVVGDGAFKVSFDSALSTYPIVEFISGENIEISYTRGRVREVIFKTLYTVNYKTYVLEETYGYGYINSHLYDGGKEVPLNTIKQTECLEGEITFNNSFMMAVPFMVFKSNKWKGRGKSVFDAKTDNFDSLDEAWSQWMDALRKGRVKEYIPSDLMPRNPETGELLKPNPFDNAFIETEGTMSEGTANKVEVIQPTIPHESYLATYVTALDLCLQGLISPSTLGIDTKKLDNADAQREKEKATLYTRNKIVEAMQNTIPILVDTILKANDTWLKSPIEDVDVDVPFGEYANPSFESQVETVSKGKQGGIMSVEASVEELYGDSKDEEWKAEEVKRLKAEQGIADIDDPGVNIEAGNFSVNMDAQKVQSKGDVPDQNEDNITDTKKENKTDQKQPSAADEKGSKVNEV